MASSSSTPKTTTTKMTHDLITAPAPGTAIAPLFTYSDEQYAQINALREYAHSISLPASDPYHKWEQRWLARADTIPRYMRAVKWKLDDAKRRIKATLEWRREFKPDLIVPDEIKIESETGKIVLNGFDKDGRPIIYMRPAAENTPTSERQLRHLVFILERAKDMQPHGQESITILIDYRGTTMRTNPSISVARKVLVILQNHYVETLGRGIVAHLPYLLNFFYKGISPFLDPVTRDKIKFNPDLTDLVPREQLIASLGGDYPYEFEPEAYWTQLLANSHIAPDGTRTDDDATGSPRADSDTATLQDEPERTSPQETKTLSAEADRLASVSTPISAL